MNDISHEPDSLASTTRACSTPHSAPLAWLKAEPPADELPDPSLGDTAEEPAPIDPELLDQLATIVARDPELLAEAMSRACPDGGRRDGWTPFLRKLFLQVLAETGRVSLACDYAGLTKQSAYALRARDPLFAAGWDAACELARAPLADALYEKAVEGVTETVTRNGEVVAERHRFDSRLSIAVLHRLDKRCDRAAELGSRHLNLVRNWDEWLSLIGKGEDQAAQAILEPAPHGQFGQLPESANPIEGGANAPEEAEELDLWDRCWKDDVDRIWMTDFPPPQGFTGYQSHPYGEKGDMRYERACTPEEIAILEADAAAAKAADRAEQEELRDEWFSLLRAELSQPTSA